MALQNRKEEEETRRRKRSTIEIVFRVPENKSRKDNCKLLQIVTTALFGQTTFTEPTVVHSAVFHFYQFRGRASGSASKK